MRPTPVDAVAPLPAHLLPYGLQDQYGDPTGRRAIYEGLDVTYLTPRLIGASPSNRGTESVLARAQQARADLAAADLWPPVYSPRPPPFPRLAAMGFPCTPDSRTRSRNDAAAVAMLLKERHDGHFMLWNAAEEGYDYSLFDNQVRARDACGCAPAGGGRAPPAPVGRLPLS
jgi:hypothetical protein